MHRPMSYQKAMNGKAGTSSDEDNAPPALGLWDRCEHLRALIIDLDSDLDKATDKELKALANNLQIDVNTNDRPLLVTKVRDEVHSYLIEPMEVSVSASTSSSDVAVTEFEIKKCEPLINFKSDNVLVVKEQFIQFVNKAGNEKYPKKGYPGPTKEILKQIHQLFNEDYYRKEDEFIISNPLKLEWHFPQEFIVMAAVKYQYHIIWDTRDGMTDTMIHWQMPITVTPDLRRESVQVVLYRRIKKIKQEITALELCPPIYARLKREGSAVSWQKTVYDPDKKDFFTKATTFPDWITDDDLEVKLVRKMRNKKIGIESFFFKASLDTFELGEHLHATNTVYYFLIHDKEIADFQEKVRPIEELHPTQAYVGKCKGTILERWIKEPSSHCQVAARLCRHIQSQRESEDHFVPGTYTCTASLLECYLLLASVLRYKCALFVLYNLNSETDMDCACKDLMTHHNTTNMHRGLNEAEDLTKAAVKQK